MYIIKCDGAVIDRCELATEVAKEYERAGFTVIKVA